MLPLEKNHTDTVFSQRTKHFSATGFALKNIFQWMELQWSKIQPELLLRVTVADTYLLIETVKFLQQIELFLYPMYTRVVSNRQTKQLFTR
mgnify:CR=1 FL=1